MPAPIVAYEALFGGHEAHLAKGERAVIPLVAQDQRATKVAFGYIRAALTGSRRLGAEVGDLLSLEIPLAGLEHPGRRDGRAGPLPPGGQADSDAEIQASIRRGMLSFPNPRLVKISTPYLRTAILWDDHRRYWGQESPDALVWRASSLLMNPGLGAERLARERRLDPERVKREYEAEFTEALESFLPAEQIEASVVNDRRELPPVAGVGYTAAVDPSGGGPDTFTLAIVHLEGARVVRDVMRGRSKSRGRTVDLDAAVAEIADICRRYGVRTVVGDRYGGEWVPQAFRDQRVRYLTSQWSKADAYLSLEPLLLQGGRELLDHRDMIWELSLLERRYHAGGRVSVDHASGHHDDFANALVLAALIAGRTRPRGEESIRPEGSLALYGSLWQDAEVDRLKQEALVRGVEQSWLDAVEAEVGQDRIAGYIKDRLEAGTMTGRLRRAGLLLDDGEDDE